MGNTFAAIPVTSAHGLFYLSRFFSGKELTRDAGIDLCDFEARQFDNLRFLFPQAVQAGLEAVGLKSGKLKPQRSLDWRLRAIYKYKNPTDIYERIKEQNKGYTVKRTK